MDKIYDESYNKIFNKFGKASTAVSLGSLLVGSLGGGISKINQKRAEKLYNSARDRFMSSIDILEDSTEKAKKTIIDVVNLKKQIMVNYMRNFLKAYKRLAPQIKLLDSSGLGELRKFVLEQGDFSEMKRSIYAYRVYDEGRLGESAANIALLMVQDGTVSNLAYKIRDVIHAGKYNDTEIITSSMDNLKIQSIGAISQFSVMAVEFGLSGMSDAFASGTWLNNAKEAVAQFDRQREIIDIKNIQIIEIEKYAREHLELLNKLVPLMEKYVTLSTKIIRNKDNILHLGKIQETKFTQNEIDVLAYTFSLIEAVKAVIDSPIISENGDAFYGNRSIFYDVQNCVGDFEKKGLELKLD